MVVYPERPLRVLVVVDRAAAGTGPHRHVVGALNALARRDDVSVRLLTGAVDPDEFFARSGRVEILRGFAPHDLHRAMRNLRLVRRASRGQDLIYIPTGLKTLLLAQVGRSRRRPLVAGPNVTHLPFRRHDAPGKLEIHYLADLWLEASRWRRDYVNRIAATTSVRHLHHGIDHEAFSPRHRDPGIWPRLGIPSDGMKILYVGRDEPRKGLHILLSAVEQLGHQGPGAAFHLVLVGPMSARTLDQALQRPNVFPLGVRAGRELATLYASADLLVVPSSWENFPFVVLEGMASGLPVIASRTGGIPEQFEHSVSGILVDLATDGTFDSAAPDKLRRSLVHVADGERRRRLGAAARRRVLNQFSEQALGERLVRLFTETIRSAPIR